MTVAVDVMKRAWPGPLKNCPINGVTEVNRYVTTTWRAARHGGLSSAAPADGRACVPEADQPLLAVQLPLTVEHWPLCVVVPVVSMVQRRTAKQATGFGCPLGGLVQNADPVAQPPESPHAWLESVAFVHAAIVPPAYVLPHVAALLGIALLCDRTTDPMSAVLLTAAARAPADDAVETGRR